MQPASNYETDFYAWAMNNARLLRDNRLSEADIDHIAEELESMGRSEKRALVNRLAELLAHLLKWQYQPARRGTSWRNTILTQRIDIQELLEDSPSLRHEIEDRVASAYEKAVLAAENETGIEGRRFPERCPYGLEQILDRGFLPGSDEEH
jgi:hypothetical protein